VLPPPSLEANPDEADNSMRRHRRHAALWEGTAHNKMREDLISECHVAVAVVNDWTVQRIPRDGKAGQRKKIEQAVGEILEEKNSKPLR
jgi:hypothetical protein